MAANATHQNGRRTEEKYAFPLFSSTRSVALTVEGEPQRSSVQPVFTATASLNADGSADPGKAASYAAHRLSLAPIFPTNPICHNSGMNASHSAFASSTRPTDSRRFSSSAGAISCMPTGMPSAATA